MKSTTQQHTLVLGGTGKTGSRIAAQLWQLNVPVRIGSRSAAIPFDWTDTNTWAPVLKGIHAVYISFQPDLAVPGAADAIQHFTTLAREAGVKKVVLLSGRGEPEAEDCEKVVIQSGIDYTIIRASWFFQNFSESHMLEPILAGYVALPTATVKEPFIDADDISDIAVAALTEDGHNGRIYEVTGSELLTFPEAIAKIAKATGRTIQYQEISMEEYEAMLKLHGVPDEFISLLNYLFATVLDGRNESVADGVQKALGRKPRLFDGYVEKTLATGIWEPQTVEG